MKVTICGSMAFFEQMLSIKKQLEQSGHEVMIPPTEIPNDKGEMISVEEYYKIRKECPVDEKWVWDQKKEAIIDHFNKVEWSESILVLNYNKNQIEGYIGANTFLEMGLALFLNKKIFLLNKIPDIPSKEELLGMKPVVLNEDLSKLS